MLITIPCLLILIKGMVVVDFEVWAPEPIEFCIVHKHSKSLFFHCKTMTGGSVRFAVEGVNKA